MQEFGEAQADEVAQLRACRESRGHAAAVGNVVLHPFAIVFDAAGEVLGELVLVGQQEAELRVFDGGIDAPAVIERVVVTNLGAPDAPQPLRRALAPNTASWGERFDGAGWRGGVIGLERKAAPEAIVGVSGQLGFGDSPVKSQRGLGVLSLGGRRFGCARQRGEWVGLKEAAALR